jgi:hypothetical protein
MTIFRAPSPPPEPAPTESYEVLALSRLTEHPLLAALYQRKGEVHEQLNVRARERQRLAEALTALEHREAEQIAALGADWDPAAYRDLKSQLADVEAEEKMLVGGVAVLDAQIDSLQDSVRDDIARRLDALRVPLVDAVVQALDSITAANRQLHAIEAKSQRLLQHSKHHLYDGGLEHRLALMKRSQHLLALAGAGDAAA